MPYVKHISKSSYTCAAVSNFQKRENSGAEIQVGRNLRQKANPALSEALLAANPDGFGRNPHEEFPHISLFYSDEIDNITLRDLIITLEMSKISSSSYSGTLMKTS